MAGQTIQAGDCVLMRPSDPEKSSYVAKIEGIEADGRGAIVKVRVRWYYRPEDTKGGRRKFDGSKEVFLSANHYGVESADTIEGKCTVHSIKNYTTLDPVGDDDFFCRFMYNPSTGSVNPYPDPVPVYCRCKMPYNPDDLMIQCESCSDWFHPACINMTAEEAKRPDIFYCETWFSERKVRWIDDIFRSDERHKRCCECEMPYNPDDLMVQCKRCRHRFHPACINMTPEEAKRLDNFYCKNCSSESQKKLQNSHNASRHSDTKVDTKRRRR